MSSSLREAFRQSQYGQLWNDPALKDFREDLTSKLKDASNTLKEKIGVTLKELLELPQGGLSVAAVTQDDPKLPIALAIIADAGKNAEKMTEVMNRSTQAGGRGRREGHRPRPSRASPCMSSSPRLPRRRRKRTRSPRLPAHPWSGGIPAASSTSAASAGVVKDLVSQRRRPEHRGARECRRVRQDPVQADRQGLADLLVPRPRQGDSRSPPRRTPAAARPRPSRSSSWSTSSASTASSRSAAPWP